MIRDTVVTVNSVIINAVTRVVQKLDGLTKKVLTGPTVWQMLGLEKKTTRETHINFALVHFIYTILGQSTILLILINLCD